MLEKISLIVEDGKVYCSSLQIAEYFDKEHKSVLASIDNLIEMDSELGRQDFMPSSYVNLQNKPQRCFLMTRDGFMFLAMGFTGEAAYKIKKLIIAEFNRMESELKDLTKMNPFELMVKQAQALLDHDLALKAQQKQLEATTNQVVQLTSTVTELVGGLGYVTVKGYATRVKRPLDTNTASKLGRACTKLCKERGLKKSEVNDERHGTVGSYPTEIVKEVFDAYFLIN